MSRTAPALEFLERLRADDATAKVVLVTGNFNILHPGHIRLLAFARELGDCLVVGVNPDTTEGVTLPVALRLEGVRSHKNVDVAFEVDMPVGDVIARLRPDIVVKGGEHEHADNPEKPALDAIGGRLVFSSGSTFSQSWDDLDNGRRLPGRVVSALPRDYVARRHIRPDALFATLDAISRMRVLVIGDVIVDEYVDCDTLGLSQEDPTIVVTPVRRKTFIGGAAIVAAHARGLGANVAFVSVVGEDESARFVEERLSAAGVRHHLAADASRPTTLKKRYRSASKTLLRVSELRQHPISPELREELLQEIRRHIGYLDLILFADFNYGCLPTEFVEEIAELAHAHGVMMAADSQASSQLADIARFRNMRLVTPTEREARMSLKDQSSGLVVVAESLLTSASSDNVIVTLGADGMLIHAKIGDGRQTDRLPALNPAPRDVAGAGDSFFCLASLALASGADIWSASLLGAVAAACQVSRVGNIPLSLDEVTGELKLAFGEVA
jgi:rfaE bifunctional protein kinase chain/domain